MSLTRAQIMAEGLAQIARSDLTSSARLWLNLFLEKIYQVQDWNWLLKRATNTLTDGGALFSDYRAFQNANLIYQSVVQQEITQIWNDQWLACKRGGTCSGPPKYVFVDEVARTFNFWPSPTLSYTWEAAYYYTPTLPDPTDAATDSQTPLWPLPNEILIKAIKLKGLFYKDDERYQAEEQAIIKEVVEAKYNTIDRRGGASKLKMGKSYRRRF